MSLQPGVQGLGPWLRSLSAYSLSNLGVEMPDLFLDLVQPPEQLQRFLSDVALVVGPQVVELAPRVREAAGLDDTLLEQRLVAAVVVAHERAAPVAEELLRVAPGAAVGDSAHGCIHRLGRQARPASRRQLPEHPDRHCA